MSMVHTGFHALAAPRSLLPRTAAKSSVGEHAPLHFHAVQANEGVMLHIADFGVEAGSLNPVALFAAQSWARMRPSGACSK
jgi:hypothetical protein